MEFDFNINTIFNDIITVITGDITFSQRHDKNQALKDLEQVIDTIGRKSAQAQKLSSSITTWPKLKINQHKIYLLKNTSPNSSKGQVTGFIKIGRKQLFVLDRDGAHNEMHPLCVLDFYVHESQQRQGQGLKLFKYMLQNEHVEASHLAVDRPSSKFISFLRKHFNLWATVPQVNNFVVFDGFFRNRNDKKVRQNRLQKQYEDSFRPISRGFSEDIIKRDRRTHSYKDSLNGIRPMSGSIITGTEDQTNYHSVGYIGQGARANRFSRFAENSDENSYVPSPPQNRRRSLNNKSKQDEEIITNPYRRISSTMSKNPDIIDNNEDSIEEESKPLQELKSFRRNDSFFEEKDEKESGRAQSNEKTENFENIFEAKIGHNSLRYARYKNPSDMITELKNKDQESGQSRGRRRPNLSNLGGTSWNLFGVRSLRR